MIFNHFNQQMNTLASKASNIPAIIIIETCVKMVRNSIDTMMTMIRMKKWQVLLLDDIVEHIIQFENDWSFNFQNSKKLKNRNWFHTSRNSINPIRLYKKIWPALKMVIQIENQFIADWETENQCAKVFTPVGSDFIGQILSRNHRFSIVWTRTLSVQRMPNVIG